LLLFVNYFLSLLESLYSLNIRSSIKMNTERNSFININKAKAKSTSSNDPEEVTKILESSDIKSATLDPLICERYGTGS
jgi:hypothetical protein